MSEKACKHGYWSSSGCVECECDQLRAEVERLREKNMVWALGVEQNNTDIVDMQRDEFKRIIALTSDTEIQGLCKRAIATIEQTFPVIVQRDQLKRDRDQWRAVAEQAIYAIKEGNNHGYGLRIGDDTLAAYEKLKE